MESLKIFNNYTVARTAFQLANQNGEMFLIDVTILSLKVHCLYCIIHVKIAPDNTFEMCVHASK